MNKAMRGIWNKCPYLTKEEIETCWRKAKALAVQQKVKGYAFWAVVAKIARGMAMKIDEERRKADEKDWDDEQRKRFERD